MLPSIGSLEEYRALYRRPEVWHLALRAICRRHHLDPGTLRPAPPGSHIVYWVEQDWLVKLFCPLWRADAQAETLALHALAQEQLFNVPHLRCAGELEGWQYLVLSRLPGVPLDKLWDHLSLAHRLEIADSLGSLIQALHRTPTPGLAALKVDWNEFLRCQIASFAAHQSVAGAPLSWVAQATAFLNSLLLLDEPPAAPVLLHADLNPEHLFCEPAADHWRITGIIDFGDAMLGHPFYEFIAPGFLFKHHPDLRCRMLRSYGFRETQLNESLSCTLLAYTLLHRFASLPEILALCGAPPPTDLADLQRILWGF